MISLWVLSFALVIAEEYQNKLKGYWEMIPIVGSLGPETEFEPINIDDTFDEPDASMDMLIFQSGKNIEWVSDIRGTSVSTKPIAIPNSQYSIAKTAYFDEDPFPDLLISSPVIATQDQKTLKVLKNKVRENLEIFKKEQLNPEFMENSDKLEDWVKFDLFTVEKTSLIIDFIVSDLNHDSIPDIILAIKHKDGTCSIFELIFSDTAKCVYTSQEIRFENSGIIELLGVYSFDYLKYSILFLSGSGSLSYMVNRDPVYSSVSMVDLSYSEKLNFFIVTDLDRNNHVDFMLGFSGQVIWVYQNSEGQWSKKTVASDGVLDGLIASVSTSSSYDLFLLYSDRVMWLAEILSRGKNEQFSWEINGDMFTYHRLEILMEKEHAWNRFKATVRITQDLERKGNLDLLIFSADEGTIFWTRKKPANLKGLGWGPEFWIYIMLYVMLMSLGAGLFHSHYSDKIEEQSVIIKESSDGPQEFVMNPISKGKPNLRKTTV